MSNGQKPFTASDRTIEQAAARSNPFGLPRVLHQAIMAQLLCNRMHATMAEVDPQAETTMSDTWLSILSSYENKLKTLEQSFGAEYRGTEVVFGDVIFDADVI